MFRLNTKAIQKAAAAPSLCRAQLTGKPKLSFPSSAAFTNQMMQPEEHKLNELSFIARNPLLKQVLKRKPTDDLFPKMKSIKDMVAEDVENITDLTDEMMEILKEIIMREKELDVRLTHALLCKLYERDCSLVKELYERTLHSRVYSGKPGRANEAAWPQFMSGSQYNMMLTCSAKFNGR